MLIENEHIKQFARAFRKSDKQLNKIMEADAELIRLDKQQVLAITTDNIVEEIDTGLYTDPHQLGWMVVTVNLSDLAAVGAEPLGITITITTPPGLDPIFLKKLASGVEDACEDYGTSVLGGDTNQGHTLVLGGTAIGLIKDNQILMRKGVQPGDHVFATRKFGQGNAFAFEKLILNNHTASFYPRARVREAKIIRQFASSCIDTSDGFIPAVSNLMEINKLGFRIDEELNHLVSSYFYKRMEMAGLPPWILLAGPHGEFELMFTIPEKKVDDFRMAADNAEWNPFYLGRTIQEPLLDFYSRGNHQRLDPSGIANLYHMYEGNVHEYIKELQKINESWLQETTILH